MTEVNTKVGARGKLRKLIEKNTVEIPGHGRLLMLSEIPPRYRGQIFAVYGPTPMDVEENLGLHLFYARSGIRIFPTDLLIELALSKVDELRTALKSVRYGSKDRYFVVYNTLFGLRRVTLDQIDAVQKALKVHIVIPSRMAWYSRFNGYSRFLAEYLEWLKAGCPLEPIDDNFDSPLEVY